MGRSVVDEFQFRGKTIQGKVWVYGSLLADWGGTCQIWEIDNDGSTHNYIVDPKTVGQMRWRNENGKYYDGDVYYHAGYGDEIVSPMCELQIAVMHGNADDIGKIKGNIHDNPELL